MRYDALAIELRALPGIVRLIAVDGCGGAGKSTFAARLAAVCGDASVVHTDDFASWEEPLEWWPRLLHEVIEPLSVGHPSKYRRYDWDTRELADEVHVDPEPIVIIEGVSASRSEWAEHLAFRIWIETPRVVRLQRGLERDGADAAARWAAWMAAEDEYVARDRPIERADLVVEGVCEDAHDSATEFVIAR